MNALRSLLALGLASSLAAVAGCGNPVHDDAVAALGGEEPGVPRGPLHRPGQPCLVCHASDGPGAPQFATAGTVFQDSMNVFPHAIPMVGATVTFTDANNLVSQVETNCAGNFYVLHDDWVAAGVAFPIHMSVAWQSTSSTMISHMGKETSCATCHVYAIPAMNGMPAMAPMPSESSVGQVYLSPAPLTPPVPGCQTSP
jgi:hypothetical protein